jgi:hypothetical protein
MTPLHVLSRASQILYVLEGELTAYLPGLSRVPRRGDSMYQPAGVPQTHRVTSSEPARVLAINSPAGFERFVAEAGRSAESLTLPAGGVSSRPRTAGGDRSRKWDRVPRAPGDAAVKARPDRVPSPVLNGKEL